MTSKLEKYLSKELYTRFGNLSIRQNYRPDWMEGLELDFYIDEYKIAAEVQGAQHYSFVEFFHKSKDDFDNQQVRDAKKKLICKERKIKLVEIFTEKDADLFVISIKEKQGIPTEKEIMNFKSYGKVQEKIVKLLTSDKKIKKNIVNSTQEANSMVAKFLLLQNESAGVEIRTWYERNKEDIDKRISALREIRKQKGLSR